jgi:hypothetical protein
MKKLLLLLDTDPIPNVYDIFVGYDGGADQVVMADNSVRLATTRG